MKVIKALLYCLLWFTLAFLSMFFVVYKEYMEYSEYKNIPTVTMKVWTWSLSGNKLPTFEELTLSLPWYSENEIYDCGIYPRNLVVKATVLNAKDEDGVVSRLVFYYYNVDDPSRILDIKETWITNPYVYFSVPRIWWEYKFWVKLYDNNWWIIDSEELLSGNPSLYIPSCYSEDTPMVTLRLSARDVEVGDTVTYTVVSRILGDSTSFEKNRIFFYDFTGDWTWDLVTWNNIVDYVFDELYPSWVSPRAGVEYRWNFWKGDWAKIYVWKHNYITDDEMDEESYVVEEYVSEYELNKMEIFAILPKSNEIKLEVEEWFSKFEKTELYNEKVAELDHIFNITMQVDDLDQYDKIQIQRHLCLISKYYDLNDTIVCTF